MIMCQADLTLERGDFVTRNFTEDRMGEAHVCRDWNDVYEMLSLNWVNWYRYRHENNLTGIRELYPRFELMTALTSCRPDLSQTDTGRPDSLVLQFHD